MIYIWLLQLRIHNNFCYLKIKSDSGQHSQFSRCFSLIHWKQGSPELFFWSCWPGVRFLSSFFPSFFILSLLWEFLCLLLAKSLLQPHVSIQGEAWGKEYLLGELGGKREWEPSYLSSSRWKFTFQKHQVLSEKWDVISLRYEEGGEGGILEGILLVCFNNQR